MSKDRSERKYSYINTLFRQLGLIRQGHMSYIYFLLAAEAICSGIIPVISVFFTKIVIDLIQGSGSTDQLIISVSILISVSIVAFIISRTINALNQAQFLLLRQKEFYKCTRLYHEVDYKNIEDAQFQDRVLVGVDALSGDGQGFQHTYTLVETLSGFLVSIVLFFAVIGYYEIYIALICFVSTVLTSLLNKSVAAYSHRREDDEAHCRRQVSYFNNTCQDFSYGKDTRLFNLKDSLISKYRDKSLSYVKVIADIEDKKYLIGLSELGILLFQDGLSYFLIIKGYYDGVLSLAMSSLYLTAIVSFTTILRTFIDDIGDLMRDLKVTSTYFRTIDSSFGKAESGTHGRFPAGEPLEIEFRHVYFRYPHTDRDVLSDLSFTIHKGEKLAIVGTNGAGKSTIVKLISGLFDPDRGRILISGIPTVGFDREEYYKMFSTVFQDFEIYACTIIENVIGNDRSPEARARGIACLERVGLKEKIESLPRKYDSMMSKVIDDEGIDLSGGQKQKIAIARALYKNGNVVILDEPTSALDALAEAAIYQSFDDLVKDKTAIYISHRLSSTKFCDHIALFDSQGLREYGTHEELMARKGEYYRMFTIQGQYYQEGEDAND